MTDITNLTPQQKSVMQAAAAWLAGQEVRDDLL